MAKTPVTPQNDAGEDAAAGKGRATPTRREREAANKRPLVADPRSSREARERARAQQDKVRAAMAAGDERYLLPRDKGPQRRFVRDWVDARWSAGELLLPVVFLSLVPALIPGLEAIASYAIFGVWAFFAFTVLDCVVLGFTLKKKLGEKFGADKVEPGYRWYAAVRSMQFRRLRMPKPQAKRGDYPK